MNSARITTSKSSFYDSERECRSISWLRNRMIPDAQTQGGRMRSILDHSFRYTSSGQTDLKRAFARMRREKREQDRMRAEADAEARLKVSPIRQGDTAAAMPTGIYSTRL
jgi:hypothetical protein